MVARFAVGIDLGTTNTVVASAPLDGSRAEVLALPQLVTAGEVEARPLLPSALYAPLEGESAADPFGDAPWVLGEHARRRGAEVAGRLVASSKSWLVHASVDRTAPILPWGAADDVPHVSPVEAAARLLGHVRHAWDQAHAGAPLAEQDVVLTVPASFDEVARELTVRAAAQAGLALEAPRGAAGGLLRLDGARRRAGRRAAAGLHRRRGPGAGRRRRRWHDGPVPRARGRAGPGRAPRRGAAPAARRRQHGPRPGPPARAAPGRGRQARPRSLRAARRRHPRREGGPAR